MKLALPLALAMVAGCQADEGPPTFETSKRYEHPLFDDPSQCPEDPEFNCVPRLDLCADGSAVILVTDIVNPGTYERSGEVIVTEWGPGDVPETIELVGGDEGVLIDDWQDWEWRASSAAADFCDED